MQADWLEQSAAKLLNNTYNGNLLWYRGTFNMGAFLLECVLSLASRKVFGRSGFKTEWSTRSNFKVVCVDNTDNGVIVDTELLSKRGAWLAVLAMAIKQHERVLTLIKVADEDTLSSVDLKQRLEETNAALDISRRSNHGKRSVGEHCVASFLRDAFPESEVSDTSRNAHACDLWMTPDTASGAFYAFECKNKGTITTKGDVMKFYADVTRLVEKHGSKFMGGVFVSCRTINIPGKGGLRLEVHAGRPVIFAGCDNGEFSWLTDTQDEHRSLRLCREMERIQDSIAPMLERVNRGRCFVDRIRLTHIVAAIDASIQAEDELRHLFS
eukprot:gene14367-20368_t